MKKVFTILFILFLVLTSTSAQAANLVTRLSGRILLQVESNGEAWYVNPDDELRYYLGRPEDAFNLMRELGLGISEANYNVFINNNEKASYNLRGKILLRVEANGEAYYVNPLDLKMHYLGRPADAFSVMRSLGLGISNNDLSSISVYKVEVSKTSIEGKIHSAINQERINNGLEPLDWNSEVAAVAKEHSDNLAKENEVFTSLEAACDYPIIHHEGFDFGTYHYDRLNNRNVYYYSKSAENIALVSEVEKIITFDNQEKYDQAKQECSSNRELYNSFLSEIEDENVEEAMSTLSDEIERRTELFTNETQVAEVSSLNWLNEDDVVASIVEGWMNSPGHRVNILEADYDEAGIGVATVNGYLIATQVFIKKVECGYYNGPCCQKAGYYPYCFSQYSCTNNVCH